MYQRILVPLDGSYVAEKAIEVGARLARASGGTVVLVEVVRGLAEFESGVIPSTNWAPAAAESERRAAKAYLTDIAHGEVLAGIQVEIATYAGAVAPTLVMACHERHADAIVMTTHGRTGLARWALGSVAHKLVHRSPLPLLLLRENSASLVPESGASEPLRALVPLDGSPLAETALLPAVRVVAALAGSRAVNGEAAVHLTRVIDAYDVLQWSQPSVASSEPWKQALSHTVETSATYLRGLAARLQHGEAGELGVTVTWSVVYDQQESSFETDVAQAILRTASAGEAVGGITAPSRCGLIAMATHGRTGISHWAMGSIADRVLQAGALPMLLVGPKSEADVA
jgi:nucleotide-binding universal stress UspA family protein